jgi:L-histidine Nalpha-methyltransferase
VPTEASLSANNVCCIEDERGLMVEILEATEPIVDSVWTPVQGLLKSPKTFPAWLLYDPHGSLLFEEITELREYYLTRSERSLLVRNASTMVDELSGHALWIVVGLGSGPATKVIIWKAAIK